MLAVKKEYRNQGIGSLLLNRFLSKVPTGACSLDLVSRCGPAIYPR